MATSKNPPCLICGKSFSSNGWKPVCEGRCTWVWQICFTSVEEGIKSARNADYETLQAAFQFMQRREQRKSLRVAIAREISKRLKDTSPK